MIAPPEIKQVAAAPVPLFPPENATEQVPLNELPEGFATAVTTLVVGAVLVPRAQYEPPAAPA